MKKNAAFKKCMENHSILNSGVAENWRRYLTDRLPMPKNYTFGPPCKNKQEHVVDGRSVRYKKSNRCVACGRESNQLARNKRLRAGESPSKLDIDRKRAELEEKRLLAEFDY